MAKINTKINYDAEEDILSISKNRKIKASIDVGDFIIDIDHRGFVAGIEILNASHNLALSELQLKSVEKGSMSITYKPNHVYISLVLKLKQKEKDVTIPLTVDLGHRSVSTETTQFAVA